jgi:hypothetical protein
MEEREPDSHCRICECHFNLKHYLLYHFFLDKDGILCILKKIYADLRPEGYATF